MSSGPSSLERAVTDELGQEPGRALLGADATDAQLDMALDEAREKGTNPFRLVRQSQEGGPAKSGRPKGARNKQSDDIAKLLAHKGIKDPVEYMAEIYNTPLDQLCALALHADGTIERQAKLDALIEKAVEQMGDLAKKIGLLGPVVTDATMDAAKALERATDRLVELSAQRATKPGDVAIKLINAQLSAAKAVADYWHSKKATKVDVSLDALPTIVMPGAGAAENYDAADAQTRLAGDLIAKALKGGVIEPTHLHGLQMVDGQLVVEGEFVELPAPDEDGGEDG